MRLKGFTRVAEALSEHYGEVVTRQQVYQWWRRKTKNAGGQPFPRGRAIKDASVKRPSRVFSSDEVIGWAEPGVPQQHWRKGWRKLGQGSQPGGNAQAG
jgi:hypothetical protein